MIVPVLANGDGGFDGLVVLLLIGVGSLWLLPVSSAVNWLKGKRVFAAIAGLLALVNGVGLLVNTESASWRDSLLLISIPVACAAAVVMFRRARPGSYWYRHWYNAARQEKAVWTYNTQDGRRRHKQTLAIASGSVVLGLFAAPLIIAGVNDLLTTTVDEKEIELTLYLIGDADEAARLLDIAQGDHVVGSTVSGSTVDLGPDIATLIGNPLVGKCLFYEATNRVSFTITPRSDDLAQEVLGRVTPNQNLVLARTERETLLDPLHLSDALEADSFAECERSTVKAFLNPTADDADKRVLSDAARTWPDVVAVAEPIWPYEQRDFAEYPALVECFGPIEFSVVFSSESDPLGNHLATRLSAEPIVERALPAWDPDAEESEEEADAFHERHPTRSDCEEHLIWVHLEVGIADPDAAVVLAALRGTKGVATGELIRYGTSEGEQDCGEPDDCIAEVFIEATLGDTEPTTLSSVANTVCHLPGVIQVTSTKTGPIDPACTPPRVEIRTETRESLEAVMAFISDQGETFREVQEHEPVAEGVSSYRVFGELDPAVCDFRPGDAYFRVEARLANLAPAEDGALLLQLRNIPGVVDVLGSAVGRMIEDPRLCGYPAIRFAVEPDFRDSELASLVDSLLAFPEVRGVDLVEGPAFYWHFSEDEPASAAAGGGTVYLHSFDSEVSLRLIESIKPVRGVLSVEVVEP